MEISLLIKVLESFVHKEGAFKATLKMISWRFYLVFIVVFYSKSVCLATPTVIATVLKRVAMALAVTVVLNQVLE